MNRDKIKATQLDALLFIEEHGVVTVYDLMHRFNYQHRGARSRLDALIRKKLIQPLLERGTWGLTDLGERRLVYLKKVRGKEHGTRE